MSTSADVIVVGAGIAGASVAAMLSAHREVLLLEAESQPGYHSTGRSAAYYAPSYGNAVVQRVTAASGPFFRDPPSGFASVPLLVDRPSMYLVADAQMQRLASLLASHPHLTRLGVDEVRARVPMIDKGLVTAGAIDHGGGDLDVDALLQGFLRLFRDRGGDLIREFRVTAVARRAGAWHASTGTDEYDAPIIVNAAGAWADNLAQVAGLGPLGLTPMRRTAALVEPPAGCDITDWPNVIDIDEQFYFKPDAGRLFISPADETPFAACDAYADDIDVAIAIDRIQAVASLDVKRVLASWAGLRTFAPDRQFVSGFDPRTDGFYWLAGQGGYGVQSSPGMADIATQLITGEEGIVDDKEVAALRPLLSPERLLG
jgi:D-arginine dehydrogenase